MLDSIYVGMTGLLGYSKGLRVIANNTANINTPGFKSSSLQFTDLFYADNGLSGGRGAATLGYGLDTGATTLSFTQGDIRQTGNALDVAVDGQGLFMLRSGDGRITYTRAGQFKFNDDGVLINEADGSKVMGIDAGGNLAEISIAGMGTSAGRATSTVKFSGNLSSTSTEQSVPGVQVFDTLGKSHSLELKFTNTNATTGGSWKVELLDGTTLVDSGEIIFVDGKPTSGTGKLEMQYTPAGSAAISLTLDFSMDTSSYAAGNLSTLAMLSQDGVLPGGLTKASFDASGTLVFSYSNQQTVKGGRLAIGKFTSTDAARSVGSNQFEALDSKSWSVGFAGEGGLGSIRSGSIEISNVDLSQEFSDLVIMQRGFQASSQVISTANEMLQQLFSIKSK